jgi:spore coat protein U-like protein
MRLQRILSAGLVLAAIALPAGAWAAQTTTTFPVNATVLKACVVTANPLNFGSYDPTAATNLDGSTTLNVLCTVGTAYTVGLNAGTGSGSTVTTRKMTNGANALNYALYQETGRTNNWGNTAGTDTPAATTAPIVPTVHTVYGRVTPGQNVPAGAYTDTITVTVNY